MGKRQRDQHHGGGGPGDMAGFEFHDRLASSPPGRMNIMMMKKAKAST